LRVIKKKKKKKVLTAALERRGNTLQGFEDFYEKAKVSTVLYVPCSLDSSRELSGSEEGSYVRLIDSCITQLKAQGPSRTCNESKEE